MKICLTAITNNLDSQLDPTFGRCAYFIIIDSQAMKFKALKNKAAHVSEGAGVLAAQIMVGKEVKHVITGNIGPRAMQALKTAGIEVNIERDITVKDAIEKFRSKTLRKTNTPTVCGYSISSQDQGGGLWRV
ncbi:MAG TPA: NifB/NifX family molybdenum-iron cluster-binding protein [Candidatus Glassbacteria bacterium]|nr:NifB/NifX family molybdenum-iron cluster-binding protein [Candidatus Glassbacteria bacterium]